MKFVTSKKQCARDPEDGGGQPNGARRPRRTAAATSPKEIYPKETSQPKPTNVMDTDTCRKCSEDPGTTSRPPRPLDPGPWVPTFHSTVHQSRALAAKAAQAMATQPATKASVSTKVAKGATSSPQDMAGRKSQTHNTHPFPITSPFRGQEWGPRSPSRFQFGLEIQPCI